MPGSFAYVFSPGTHVIVRADWGDVGAGVLGLAVRSAVDLLFVLLKMRRMPK